jgi:hypothetical protein
VAGRCRSAYTFLPPAGSRRRFSNSGGRYKDERGWQFVSFACGHDVMVDRPQELAAALIAAA